MLLQNLLSCKGGVAIQCHDDPDADALASGWALSRFLEEGGREPLLFYGGSGAISKPNLVKMVEELQIPVQYRPELRRFGGLLLTVDCQHGARNVQRVEADCIAVVDHHVQVKSLPELCILRPGLGSCSTLVWKLLDDAGFKLDRRLQTALLYGLFTDTNSFSEIRHPLDRDMQDALQDIDEDLFTRLRRSNVSPDGMRLVARALETFSIDGACATLHVDGCDPNMLGLISDFVLQVDGVDTVVATSWLESGGCKFSVRTSAREAPAPLLAKFLAGDMGDGGGHEDKAGGWISKEKFRARHGDRSMQAYMAEQTARFSAMYAIVDCAAPETLPDLRSFQTFRKIKSIRGAVFGEDLCSAPSRLRVRTLEGDLEMDSAGAVILFGVMGEVYATKRSRFEQTYALTGGPYRLPEAAVKGYQPNVLDMAGGRRFSCADLVERARACVNIEEPVVKARQLGEEEHVLVFPKWDSRHALAGHPGDWISSYGPDDFAVISRDIFALSYRRADS